MQHTVVASGVHSEQSVFYQISILYLGHILFFRSFQPSKMCNKTRFARLTFNAISPRRMGVIIDVIPVLWAPGEERDEDPRAQLKTTRTRWVPEDDQVVL